MPISGTLDVGPRAAAAPEMESLHTEALTLEGVQALQVMAEIDAAGMEALLPAALHPTIPPTVTWSFWSVPSSPWGPFRFAFTRIGCRAGVRPRGFPTSSFVDNPEAAAALSARWGFRTQAADVRLAVRHDRITGTAVVDGRTVLEAALIDPEAISGGDVFFFATMNLARTPMGLRLVQVDPEFVFHRADRGRPHLATFDAAACGDERVRPVYPVSATSATVDIALPVIRYVCDPDVPALQGTEKVV